MGLQITGILLPATIIFIMVIAAISCERITSNNIEPLADNVKENNSKAQTIAELLKQNREKQIELEKAQKLNKGFEKMIQLVNILGQVDSFLSDRTKSMLRKLSMLAEDEEAYFRSRRS